MLKEIHEQPEALRQSIAGRVGRDNRIVVEELAPLGDMLRAVDRVELVACGSAFYAATRRGRRPAGLDRAAGPRDRRLGVPLQPAAAR